jgi:glutamate synthase (NADPH/NADH) small chain
LLTYGIPGFKLEKDVVMRRVKRLEDGGVEIVTNCNIGTNISFADLREKHDAVLIATGVYNKRGLKAPGAGLSGIVQALDFLTTSNHMNFGDPVQAEALSAKGKKVVVIGGGDTAMDCVRTAIRQGAESVKCLYRRDRANMPGSMRETQNAEEEGVEFHWLRAPKAFTGEGHVTGVRVAKMRLGAPDASGRRAPEEVEGADYTEAADLVILALGFTPENLPALWGAPELEVTDWTTIRADHATHATSLPGVFAVGDIVRGASLVVWAIRDGRDAADSIAAYLGAKALVAAE